MLLDVLGGFECSRDGVVIQEPAEVKKGVGNAGMEPQEPCCVNEVGRDEKELGIGQSNFVALVVLVTGMEGTAVGGGKGGKGK